MRSIWSILTFFSFLAIAFYACTKTDNDSCSTCSCQNVSEGNGSRTIDSFHIFIPNVFTPNGDNINDNFTPVFEWNMVKSAELTITNREKTQTYYKQSADSNTAPFSWDGTFNGNMLKEQIYAWKLTGTVKWNKTFYVDGKIYLNPDCQYDGDYTTCRFADQISLKQGFVYPTSEKKCN